MRGKSTQEDNIQRMPIATETRFRGKLRQDVKNYGSVKGAGGTARLNDVMKIYSTFGAAEAESP